jgi:hypothetical protein
VLDRLGWLDRGAGELAQFCVLGPGQLGLDVPLEAEFRLGYGWFVLSWVTKGRVVVNPPAQRLREVDAVVAYGSVVLRGRG